MAELLRKMRFGAEPAGADKVKVQVPCYRADIMHDWDLFEDVAIAYGYDKLESQPPKTFTVGKPHPVQVNAALAREAFTGLGYLEVMPFTLTSEDVLYKRMQREETKGVLHVMHPISIENTVVRTELLPLLLEFLTINRHRELPQRLFTVGDVVLDCRTYQQAAGVSTHPDADFSEAYASADAVLHELSIDYTVKESADPAFIDGRRGDIIVPGKKSESLARSIPLCSSHSSSSTPLPRSSSTSEPYRDIPASEILFYLFYRELTIVEDTCRKAGIGLSLGKTVIEMFERPDPAARDDRDTGSIGDRCSNGDIEPVLRPVGLHAGEEDLSGSPLLGFLCPGNRIDAGGFAAAVDDHLVPARATVFERDGDRLFIRIKIAAHVHGTDDALGAEGFCSPRDEGGVVDSARIEAHFVRPCPQDLLDIIRGLESAPDREREEELVGRTLDEIDDDAPLLL